VEIELPVPRCSPNLIPKYPSKALVFLHFESCVQVDNMVKPSSFPDFPNGTKDLQFTILVQTEHMFFVPKKTWVMAPADVAALTCVALPVVVSTSIRWPRCIPHHTYRPSSIPGDEGRKGKSL
jgi:hypothetical protein